MPPQPVRVLLMLAVVSAGCASDAGNANFMITTQRADDRVEIKFENDQAVVSIHSPAGISQAVIESSDKNWPAKLTLRLHLKGLENFKVASGKTTLEATISSHGDPQPVRLWISGQEDSPLDPESKYWTQIRMVGNDGKAVNTIPLVDGYFEMRLPAVLFAENPRSITINWIDFYR